MRNTPAIACLAIACLILGPVTLRRAHAEARIWTSADGGKTLRAEFVKLDGDILSLRRDDGIRLAFSLDKLSPADRVVARELAEKAAASPGDAGATDAMKADISVFNRFRFGESREEVEEKLKKNDAIEGGVIEEFMARTGINGIFYIELEGDRFDLFFDFDAHDKLREISLQSSAYDPGQYDVGLRNAWKRLRSGFIIRHGEPTLSSGYPKAAQITEGVSMSSDIWKLDGRYIYLGTGMVDGCVSCVLRCSAEEYKPPDSDES